ncbi:MAG TPA: YggS family pyridoxal phosphate-dependent enzyme [bacterium]|nr:YggS family pyridoxal phosphate-dependent enzyme [bacterium]
MATLAERLAEVHRRIEVACRRSGRGADEVALVAVTKTVPLETVQAAVEAGVGLLGENKVQEAAAKIEQIKGNVAWHMLGHLQTNKVKKAVAIFDMIQSVDSEALAVEIDRRSAEAGRVMDVLVEVNTSGEVTKFGASPEDCVDLVSKMSHLRHISVRGLMTIGAFTPREEVVRTGFRLLRDLKEAIQKVNIANVKMDFLSMGMTSDFEVAIEEGSNMVRIGTAIFGERRASPAS